MNQNISELYRMFLGYSYSELKEFFDNSSSKEEQYFYKVLCDIVLEREGKGLIGMRK